MTKRKSLTKKSRFDVFKRDDFTCQYCGSHPPSVTLEVDHIKPVSKGGTNDVDNLIASCFDCNRGKSNHDLDSIPLSITEKLEVKKEAANQLEAYEKFLSSEKRKISRKVKKIELLFANEYEATFTKSFKTSISMFINRLTYPVVDDAMEIALSRMNNEDSVLDYFCGICWNKIKETDQG